MNRDPNDERREQLTRHICSLMGWEYKTGPVWSGLRRAAMAQAVVLGLDKLEEVCDRMEINQFNANRGDVHNQPASRPRSGLAGEVETMERRNSDAMGLLAEICATFRLGRNRQTIGETENGRELLKIADGWQRRYDLIVGFEELGKAANA